MKREKGFTLVEILVAMGIFSIIGGLVFTFLSMGVRAQKVVANEYDIQSEMRVVSQTVNNVVRNAKATYIKNKDNGAILTKGWDYIIYDKEAQQVLQYIYRGEGLTPTHRKVVLGNLEGYNNIEYNLEFMATGKDMLAFKIYANILNEKGNIQERIIDTELKALNTLGGIDATEVGGISKPGEPKPGNALAYRTENLSYGSKNETGNSEVASIAAISMVLDTSGSMSTRMGSTTRIQALKNEAKEMLKNLESIVNDVKKSGGDAQIHVSLIPFSSNANVDKSMERIPNKSLTASIDGLNANGGTNTGDGMRLGLAELYNFKELKKEESKKINNFMIILIDGVTSMSTINKFEKTNPRTVSSSKNGTYAIYETGNGGLSSETAISSVGQANIRELYFYEKIGRQTWKYDVNPVYLMDLNGISSSNWIYSTVHYIETNPKNKAWGRGNALDYFGTIYTEKIGEEIKKFQNKEGENIKVYVIAFTDVQAEKASANGIGIATGAQKNGPDYYFTAGSSDELKKVFEDISYDVKTTIEIDMGGELSRPE